jgi:hypothetical protein
MFVKPASGVLLRDPTTKRVIPPEGAEVEECSFWHRRALEGDVTLVAPAPEMVVVRFQIPDSKEES